MEQEKVHLEWPEYLVFAFTLSISAVIGTYYGFFGSKQNTTKEYLLANREMSAWLVSLSLVCSAVSAISILGNPVEVYLYGAPAMLIMFTYIPFTISLGFLYLPVYFQLNVNSAYEYIELRFNSRVRTVVSLIAVVQLIVSMAIDVYAPSLALNQVTGISTRASTAVIYAVCIFYSAMGGLKAVLWTDAFQAFIMLASVLVTVIIGLGDVGGFSAVWKEAGDAGRLDFVKFDPDPRTRHTIWAEVIGGYFFVIPTYAATQVQVQRYLSMPTITEARKALLLNAMGLVVIIGLSFFTGLVIFARYAHCDPITANLVEKSDQLLPYFVVDSVRNIPGLIGLFVAGITCASMSGLSALASIATYDYIGKFWPHLSDARLSFISKLSCLVLGIISFLFVFVVENMGDILPAASAVLGIFLGPILGLFTLGMLFPSANSKGSLSAMFLSMFLMLLFVVGNQIASSQDLLTDQRLSLRTDGCSAWVNETMTEESLSSFRTSDWKDKDDSALIQFLSVSYLWYTSMGVVLTLFLGLTFSFLVRSYSKAERSVRVKRECLSSPAVWMWEKFAPQLFESWVESSVHVKLDKVDKSDYVDISK